MQVDWRAFRHKRIHIGDADQHPGRAVRQFFCVFNLVEIAGGVIVNGRPQKFTQILDVSGRRLWRLAFDCSQLLRDRRRKFRLKAVFQHELFCGCLKVEVGGTWNCS